MLFLLEERVLVVPRPLPVDAAPPAPCRACKLVIDLLSADLKTVTRTFSSPITRAMAFVDAYARVTDLQQLVATLPAAAPAESTPAPGAASFDARLNAALPAVQASAVAPQPEVALPAAQASAVAPQPEVALPSA